MTSIDPDKLPAVSSSNKPTYIISVGDLEDLTDKELITSNKAYIEFFLYYQEYFDDETVQGVFSMIQREMFERGLITELQ